ncbi:MAG TPA: polysaccharide deacetylase family protein [Kofleriaceae bacterium]|jgi:peptidoglycan/xylan/chitin deacetylase (PgdA/CDA1 family)
MLDLRTRLKNAVLDHLPGILRRGPATGRRVALTFDDGPDEMTPRYLDVLDQLGVPATFFLVGDHAEQYPHHVRDYIRRGHQVGGHGADHKRFSKMSRRELMDQCERTDRAIGGQLTGRSWVRPPHGTLDPRSILALASAGYTIAMWSVDPEDYEVKDPAVLAERCAPGPVQAGDVLLFHEGQEWTLAALPQIVTALQASGLECVTMFDLFAK